MSIVLGMHVLSIQMLWFVTGSLSIFWGKQHTKMVSRISPIRCENRAIFSFRVFVILLCQFISIAVELNCLFPLLFTIFRNRSELVYISKSAYRMIVTCISEATYTKMFVQKKGYWRSLLYHACSNIFLFYWCFSSFKNPDQVYFHLEIITNPKKVSRVLL